MLAHTAGLWDELAGQRLFFTGGTGFFGQWLLESLEWANRRLERGIQAVVLTRDAAAFRLRAPHLAGSHRIQLWEGDICRFAFPPGRFDQIIHAATPTSATAGRLEPAILLQTSIDGTRRTLELARVSGARNFLLTSSGAVYGTQPPDVHHVPEDHQGGPDSLEPGSAYGEGKRVAELLCCLAHRQTGLGVKIARGFAFVGPLLPLDQHFAIGNFMRDGLAGGPIVVNGDGTSYRSYLHAADLVAWLWTILLKAPVCRPFNVGGEEAITIRELAHRVGQRFGTPVEIRGEPVPGAPASRYVPSTRRAQVELGLKPWIGFDEALDRTIRWHRKRRETP